MELIKPLEGAARVQLLMRLYGMLAATHRKWQVDPESFDEMVHREDAIVYPVGQGGVLAFFGDYALCAWSMPDTHAASRDAFRLISARLKERGFTRHVVHPCNFRSVKLTRKMGALPEGVDADGFVHYRLDSERFPHHGQEVTPTEAARS